jgi:radical SAM superfamily enzyme YgiQ (UPF0313 family)
MDLLLSHGFYLANDSQERRILRPYPPLGLLYISSHLKALGLRVEVFDGTFGTETDFAALVARERPPVVGLYANLMTRPAVVRMARVARRHGARVVVGGPDPAEHAEAYLAHGADVVVIGEGELTLEALVPHLAARGLEDLDGVAGIVFRRADGRLVRTAPRPFIADLDAQPLPDRDAVDLWRYLDAWRASEGLGSISLITARGCPYTCAWCSHGVFGYTHRRRSPAAVADELQHIVRRWAPGMVWYADDVFTINHRWLETYRRELDARGLRVPFETISREDRLNEAVVRTLAAMGCRRLWIGSESGSQRVMDAMDRGTDVVRVRDMVRLLQRHDIEAGLFVMLGYEGEEMADLEATVEHLKAAQPDRFLTTLAYPIKGTPFHDRVADRLLAPREWEESSERDLEIVGRRSRRFYGFATRWMVNEVAWHRERQWPRPRLGRLARTYVNAKLGRLGMRLTARERTAGPRLAHVTGGGRDVDRDVPRPLTWEPPGERGRTT